jgi:hypothetical protein
MMVDGVMTTPDGTPDAVLVVHEGFDPVALRRVQAELARQQSPVLVVTADRLDEVAAQHPALRARLLIDDASRLNHALIEHLKTLPVMQEEGSRTWRDLLPDAPQFKQAGPRPPRRHRRR